MGYSDQIKRQTNSDALHFRIEKLRCFASKTLPTGPNVLKTQKENHQSFFGIPINA